MKKTIMLAYLALILSFLLPFVTIQRENAAVEDKQTESGLPAVQAEAETQQENDAPAEAPAEEAGEAAEEPQEAPKETEGVSADTYKAVSKAEIPAPESIKVLVNGEVKEMNMQEYLVGVVAAEMPADFDLEALKAQAVAARSFAIYCADGNKHSDADVCTDFNCCQAYINEDKMRENWGENFEENYKKISSAVAETEGQYLSYDGKAVFAAFHSASNGSTEDCGEIWGSLPYLVSVESPENEKTVPNFISTLECAPIDFRDCILSRFPEADFTGEESSWIGELERDRSGRVKTVNLGGVEIKGTDLRQLFSLRSTSFELQYTDGKFLFTVKGFGHGVGMSQYGAKIMAREGSDYISILAHYYPGTSLIC